jgi:autophagy-related protein 9
VIATSRLLNLAALAFTIVFSAFLLLGVDWGALRAQCLMAHDRHSCDILTVAVHDHPLRGRSRALVALAAVYVALCCLYWAWSAVAAVGELRSVLETRHFVANKLGISERQVRRGQSTWAQQRRHRCCARQRQLRGPWGSGRQRKRSSRRPRLQSHPSGGQSLPSRI